MRPIDADKLHPDRMTNKGTVAISQSQIARAPTLEVVALSKIREAEREIEEEISDDSNAASFNEELYAGMKRALDIFKKHIQAPEPVRAYPCDPEKNTSCKKTGCYERGGPCKLTLNPEYAKEEQDEKNN